MEPIPTLTPETPLDVTLATEGVTVPSGKPIVITSPPTPTVMPPDPAI